MTATSDLIKRLPPALQKRYERDKAIKESQSSSSASSAANNAVSRLPPALQKRYERDKAIKESQPQQTPYEFLVSKADPKQSQALMRTIEQPTPFLPTPLKEKQFQQKAQQAWKSLTPAEKHEYGYRYTDWGSISLEERKQYYGASKYFKDIPESEKTRIAKKYVSSYPEKKFLVSTVQPGLAPIISETATGFKPGAEVSFKYIQQYKHENILEDVATLIFTKGRSRRPTYEQASKSLIESAKYDLFYTAGMKQETKALYYKSMPQYKRIGIAMGHATVTAAVWPITLSQAGVKYITGKTHVLPDVAAQFQKSRLGPPGVIGPAISEVWLKQDVSYIKEQQKEYPLETIFATVGEIAGMYAGGKTIGFAYKAAKSSLSYTGSQIKFRAPYSIQQLPYKIRFKYSQVTGRGMYTAKTLTPTKKLPPRFLDPYEPDPITAGLAKPRGRFLYDTKTGHATKLATGKEFTKLGYKKSEYVYDVGIKTKTPQLATGKPKTWIYTHKSAIKLAGWKKFDDIATQSLLISKQQIKASPMIQNITYAGRVATASKTGSIFGTMPASAIGYGLSQRQAMRSDLGYKSDLYQAEIPKLERITQSDIKHKQTNVQDVMRDLRQDQFQPQIQAQARMQAQATKQQQDYMVTWPTLNFLIKSKPSKTYHKPTRKAILFGLDDKFFKKKRKLFSIRGYDIGYRHRKFKVPRIEDLIPGGM